MKKPVIVILLLIIIVSLFYELLYPFPILEALGTSNNNVFSIIPAPTPEQLEQIRQAEAQIKETQANAEQRRIIREQQAAANLARKQAADIAKAAELARQQAAMRNAQQNPFFSNRSRGPSQSYTIYKPYKAPARYTQPSRRHR